MAFEVITLPGHSIGISALYDQHHRTMIVSDAAQGYGSGIPLIFYSPRQYRASIKRLMSFDIDRLVLGHPFLWSGEPRYVHQGKDDIQQFLNDCLEASEKVSKTIREIVESDGNLTYAELEKAAVDQLQSDASYGYDPAGSQWRHGTILSELRELKSVSNFLQP